MRIVRADQHDSQVRISTQCIDDLCRRRIRQRHPEGNTLSTQPGEQITVKPRNKWQPAFLGIVQPNARNDTIPVEIAQLPQRSRITPGDELRNKRVIPTRQHRERIIALHRTNPFALNGIDKRAINPVARHLLEQLTGRIDWRPPVVAIADPDIGIKYGNARSERQRHVGSSPHFRVTRSTPSSASTTT